MLHGFEFITGNGWVVCVGGGLEKNKYRERGNENIADLFNPSC